MRIGIKTLLLLFAFNVQAGLFDFVTIQQADQAYQQADYSTAVEKYRLIDHPFAQLNRANALYKQGRYEDALVLYKTIGHQDLAFERLYNMGNSHAKSNRIDEAITHYQQALALREDADARFNLELLQQQKQQQKQQQETQQKQQSPERGDSQPSAQNQQPQDDGSQAEKLQQLQQKTESNKPSDDVAQQPQSAQQVSDKTGEPFAGSLANQETSTNQVNQQKKVDQLEQRRWEKALQKRVRTFMLPLKSEQHNHNDNTQKPW